MKTRKNSHMVIFASNKTSWIKQNQLISKTNDHDYFYYKPRIHPWNITDENGVFWPGLESYVGDGIIGILGHQGSYSDFLFCKEGDDNAIEVLQKTYRHYKGKDTEYYRQFLREDWLESLSLMCLRFQKAFGKNNFFLEVQDEYEPTKDLLPLTIQPLIKECIRSVSKNTGIECVATGDAHYAFPENHSNHKVLISVMMKETEDSIEQKLSSDSSEIDLFSFLGSSQFYIKGRSEYENKFTKEELDKTLDIASRIEEYDITHAPFIPEFQLPEFPKHFKWLENCPNDYDKYLMYLCVQGALKLKPWESDIWDGKNPDKKLYWDRLNEELAIIFKANLSTYFLIVWDFCMAGDFRPPDHSFDWQLNLKNKGKIDGIPRGWARGSSAGCLISFLTGITEVDPLRYKLLFTRFFNIGRMSEGRFSLPDCDIDFACFGRQWILDYIAQKYGQDRVAPIITFQTVKGKNAIRDFIRVKNIENGLELASKLCDCIPDEASINDELETIKKSSGDDDYNTLKYALDNNETLKEYCKDPKIKELLEQASQYCGVRKSQGKHPSGVIVSPIKLDEYFPMVRDPRGKQKVVGITMGECEKMGLLKFDVLGVVVLDKLQLTQELYNDIS